MSEPAAEYKSQTINEIIQSDQEKSIEIGRLKAKISSVDINICDLLRLISSENPSKKFISGYLEMTLRGIRQ